MCQVLHTKTILFHNNKWQYYYAHFTDEQTEAQTGSWILQGHTRDKRGSQSKLNADFKLPFFSYIISDCLFH